jgi:hypothetical protein
VSQAQGLVRVQILISLLSLRGLSFYSGILGKEVILNMLTSSSWYLLMLGGVMLRVYLTLMYRVLIYKALFSSSLQPVNTFQIRLGVLLTSTEGVLTICYFR